MLRKGPARKADATYVRIRPYFINIDRNPLRLLALLYTKSGPLGIIDWNAPLMSVRSRSSALYILTSIGLKWLAGRTVGYLGSGPASVSLPNLGDVAMFCFPEYVRLFDLDTARITNIRAPESADGRERLSTMIAHQKNLAALGIAPKIYEQDETRDNYVEELCDGARLKTRQWWCKGIFEKVGAAVKTIQRSNPALVRRTGDRVRELREALAALPQSSRENPAYSWLCGQVEAACGSVDGEEKTELFVSHGDLARRNILVRRDGAIVCIDWHTVDYRSRDYDLYNYHFSIVQGAGAKPLSESNVFGYLHDALGQPESARAIEDFRRFRLEFLLTRLKYFLLPGAVCQSRASRVLEQIRGYAECFSRYEEYCSGALRSG